MRRPHSQKTNENHVWYESEQPFSCQHRTGRTARTVGSWSGRCSAGFRPVMQRVLVDRTWAQRYKSLTKSQVHAPPA